MSSGGEWVTNRSSATSSDPDSAERFTMVDPVMENTWKAWRRTGPAQPDWPQRTPEEQLKSAFLAGWIGREYTASQAPRR